MKSIKARYLNSTDIINLLIGLLGIGLILVAVVFMQFFYGIDRCMSCTLQRITMVVAGLSLLMNFRYGNKVLHWSCTILTSCVGISVSAYQILWYIHSTHGYGGIIFGYHLYTWTFICFAATIIFSAIMLIVYPEQRYCN